MDTRDGHPASKHSKPEKDEPCLNTALPRGARKVFLQQSSHRIGATQQQIKNGVSRAPVQRAPLRASRP